MIYAPEYKPENPNKWEHLNHFLGSSQSHEDLKQRTMLCLMDMSFPRPDILVVLERTKCKNGWED